MARTARDIEAYLTKLERHYETLDEHTYVLYSSENSPPIAVRIAPPMLVVRVLIGPVPKDNLPVETALMRRLLELNATELLYCAYGLEDGKIVLTSALELENLDLNELEAVLGDMDLALTRHVPQLRELSKV